MMDRVEAGVELVDPEPSTHIELLEALLANLDDAPDPEPWQYPDKALLAELQRTQRELSRLQARWLLAEAEAREATLKVAGLPTSSWLADRNTHWARSAREEVRFAVALSRQPQVSSALTAGELSIEQARVISTGVERLPSELDADQRTQVEAHLVRLATEFGPYGLSRLVNRAVEVVAPEVAEAADARAIERAEAEQQRTRHLTWSYDADGALLLRGKFSRWPARSSSACCGRWQPRLARARRWPASWWKRVRHRPTPW